jgi:DNA polymerase I-like protein with 3'-5' exonuclease and polymerase domains/uracil-DNA glycosylase
MNVIDPYIPKNFNGIVFVGDYPHEEEVTQNRPFSRYGEAILKNLCNNAGINVMECGWTYMSRVATPFPMEPDRTVYLSDLRRVLNEVDAKVVVLLGAAVLKAAGSVLSLDAARGSSFMCRDASSPFNGMKCVATFHPRDYIGQHDLLPVVRLDLEKIKRHSVTKDLMHPQYHIDLDLSADDVVNKLDTLTSTPGTVIAMDIEGGCYMPEAITKTDKNKSCAITCLSIATSSEYAFAISLKTYTLEEEMRVIRALNRCMRSYNVKKVLQNYLYDSFVMSYQLHIPILNCVHDTMLSGWEIYPELPKALGHQASIWTDFPAYKHERTIPDWHTHLEYCCKDSLVTFELYKQHTAYFSSNPKAAEHFKFNMRLLPILLGMELRGMNYDKEKAVKFTANFNLKQTSLQAAINAAAGRPVNINSPKQMSSLLYDPSPKGFGFKKQHPKQGNRKDVTRTTSNVDAILELKKLYDNYPILDQILGCRKLEKFMQTTAVLTDPDSRVRCSYNPVGTDTGRVACYESNTGSGTNLQTITKKLRCLYLSDPGYYFFQCDLSGADGWTVAARCAELGDPTMLDDYYYGLKPAKIIALMYLHGPQVNSWSREEIKQAGKDIGNGDTEWLYFAGKRAQHGTNYLLGPRTMSGQILKDSYKYLNRAIVVSPKDCERLQTLYKIRYPGVERWQNSVAAQLRFSGTLPCASGHVRRFFGRPNDNSVIQSAVSHEPQANTTYVTNRAAYNIYTTPNSPIHLLHQVHDAVLGQFPVDQVDHSLSIIRNAFNFPISIGKITLTIPFEGFYGLSWGDCDPNSGTPVGTI